MELLTSVSLQKAPFLLLPSDEVLLVGSCFAGAIGQRFKDAAFRAVVNPFGTMYNPVSVGHTVALTDAVPRVAFFTLGTNHVYREKLTGQIVDNCRKRPASLFEEERLSVGECADALLEAVRLLRRRCPGCHVVFTVSPIRYRKYGFHESQLSKATLLLAVEETLRRLSEEPSGLATQTYFPAYEILLDELRDYRFYAPDMLHPSEQAADYVWERLADFCFSPAAKDFLRRWLPIRKALDHRPINPGSEAYAAFRENLRKEYLALAADFPHILEQQPFLSSPSSPS